MPDVDKPAPNRNFEELMKRMDALQAQEPSAADRLRNEARPLLMNQGNCIRCHDKGGGQRGLDLQSFDFNKPLNLKGYDLDAALKPRIEDPRVVEARTVEKFKTQPIVDKAFTVLNRLPDKIDVAIDKDKIALTTDFVKAIEAIPGVKLDDEMKGYLSKLKTVSFENGQFKLKMDKAIDVKIGTVGPEISFDVKNDPSKPDGVGLTNIKGVTILAMPVESLSLKEDKGKTVLKVTGNFFGKQVEKDVDPAAQGANPELLRQAIGQLAEYKPMLQNRDFGKFTNDVPDGFRDTVNEMLKGVSSITKDGSTFTLRRTNGVSKFDFGGPSLDVQSAVSFKLGTDPDAPSIKDLTGITVSLPLPDKLGMGDKYTASLKGLSLGYSDSDGGRTIKVDADNVIESVKVRLDSEFKPRTDGAGNWNLNVRGSNPLSNDRNQKMDIDVRIGRDGKVNMQPSEVLDIVSRLTWQASDVSGTGASLALSAGVAKVSSWISWLFE
jgi:hypothetical protein